jgi:CRISPR/Cas system endoribonuclease Cas6 (RAMP superfamily)
MVWDRSIIAQDVIQNILLDSGQLVGVGNGRGIGMGRFIVLDFQTSGVEEVD